MECSDSAPAGQDPTLDLARTALQLARACELPEQMRLARTAARALTGADGVTLVLREGDQCRYADEDAIGPLWKGQRFALTDCISGWVMLRDEAVMVDDIYADPRVPYEAYRSTFVRSLSMVPIRRGEPLGALGCYWARRGGAQARTLRVQQVLADALALAFENTRTHRRLAAAQARASTHATATSRTDATSAAPAADQILLALRQSEARYRLLVEQAPDGIFLTDGEGRCLDVNEAGARMLGYSRDEILACCIADLVAPEEVARIPEEIAHITHGAVVTSRWRLLRKDGATFPGEVVGRRLPDGRLQGIVRDISARQRAETALQASESFHRQALESIPGMVFTTRPDGYCDYQSQQWMEYTGVTMNEQLGDGWNALLHPDDRAPALAAWHEAVAERATYDLEYRVQRSNGSYEWFRVNARPIRDDLGRIVRWLGVAMNIERLKRAEARRIATLTQQRDTLVREVHHRIKNHLQGVIGLLHGAMARGPAISEPLEAAIAQIRAIAQVHGLQARGDDGRLPMLELLRTAAASAAGTVRVEHQAPGNGPGPAIAGDHAVAIALIINELITNAVKHRLPSTRPGPVRVILEVDAHSARIAIRNGPARLPPQFDFAHKQGLGDGLKLVADLLPDPGAELLLRQHGDDVEARLSLRAPIMTPYCRL